MASKKKRYKPSKAKKQQTTTVENAKEKTAQTKQTKNASKLSFLFANKNPWIYAILVAIASLIAYSSAFDNELTNWDDNFYITDNEQIHELNGKSIREFFASDDPEVRYHMGNYHPLTMLSLAIDYQLGGTNAEGKPVSWPYITNNILLHTANAVLVFWLIFLLWGRVDIAFITALLFGVHALHVESVAWISERKDVLYTFFYLASLTVYIKYLAKEKLGWIVGAFLLFLLSLLSKGQAVTLAPTLILIDWIKGRKLLNIKLIVEKIPFFLLALIFGIIAIKAQDHGQAIHRINEYPFYIRILFACLGFSQYLFKLVAPLGLAAIYPYPILTKMQPTPSMWLHMLSTAAFLGVGVWAFTKKYYNMVFGFAFFIVNIALLLQLIPVGSAVMADRYSYIPSIGIHAIMAFMFVALYQRLNLSPKVVLGLVGAYAVFLGALAFKQADTWQNSFAVWDNTLKVSPKSIVAWNNRGSLKEKMAKDGEKVINPQLLQEGIYDFDKAIAIKPDYTTALYNRGVAYHDLKKFPEALKDFNEAIKHDPTFGDAYHNRGLVKDKTGKLNEAIIDFNRALEFKPSEQKVYVNRGVSKGKLGKYEEAIADFDKAIQMAPTNPSAYSNRGLANDHNKNYEAALRDYNKAIELDNSFLTAYANRGLLYMKMQRWENAVTDFTTAIQLDPQNGSHYFSRARCYLQLQQTDKVCNELVLAQKYGMQGLDDDIQRFCKGGKTP